MIFEHQKESEENSLYKPGLTVKQEPEFNDPEESTSHCFINLENNPSCSNTNTIHEEIKEETSLNNMEFINKPIDITEKVDIVKNIDLFKAVFSDTSEDESEHDDHTKSSLKEKTERNDMIKSNILGEVLIPKVKAAKEGILSNIRFTRWDDDRINDSSTIRTSETTNDSEIRQSDNCIQSHNTADSNIYGPKLPKRIIFKKPTSIEVKNSSSDDEWVEKDKHKKKSHKHKKKHKKEKHRKKHKKNIK